MRIVYFAGFVGGKKGFSLLCVSYYCTFFAKCIGVWENSLFPLFRGRNPLKDENLGKKRYSEEEDLGLKLNLNLPSCVSMGRGWLGWRRGRYFSRGKGGGRNGASFSSEVRKQKRGDKDFPIEGRKCDHT